MSGDLRDVIVLFIYFSECGFKVIKSYQPTGFLPKILFFKKTFKIKFKFIKKTLADLIRIFIFFNFLDSQPKKLFIKKIQPFPVF